MLETTAALKNKDHPMHAIAVEYTDGINKLREEHGQKIRFIRPGFPKKSKGIDSRGRETMMLEPATPALFPLEKVYVHNERGEEIWSCCLQTPVYLPNGLWSIGKKKSIKIDEYVIVDLSRQPDLAYYLAYIAKFERKGLLKIDDPMAEIRERDAEERRMVEVKSAIYQMLDKEDDLRKIAAAYGVSGAYTNDPAKIRLDLVAQLEINDTKRNKQKDMTIRGTREFLEDLKVSDNVRLRAFVKRMIDNKTITYKPDGRFRIGDKPITQVPHSEIGRRDDWLCGFYAMPNNKDHLQELMRDVIDKKFLDGITDEKDLTWIAKVFDVNTVAKKKEDIKSSVYGVFNVAL